jgi:hypothetical protein
MEQELHRNCRRDPSVVWMIQGGDYYWATPMEDNILKLPGGVAADPTIVSVVEKGDGGQLNPAKRAAAFIDVNPISPPPPSVANRLICQHNDMHTQADLAISSEIRVAAVWVSRACTGLQ